MAVFLDLSKWHGEPVELWHKTNPNKYCLSHKTGTKRIRIKIARAQKVAQFEPELVAQTTPEMVAQIESDYPINTISGSFDTSQGDLRKAQVYVDKKYFPDYSKMESLLGNLVDNINKRIDDVSGNDIIKLSADFHYNLVNIHPFGDGNGRTSRLMMNYIQLYHDEPLIKIFTEDRADYINALNKTEELEDISIFRDFVCQQQIKFYKAEISKYKKKDRGFNLMF